MKSVSVSCTDDRVVPARRGALSPGEWQDFATHLTECVECRIAWRLGNDFEHSAAARPGDERIIARGVKAALALSTRPHTKLIRFAIAASVTLVMAGMASAGIVLQIRHSTPAPSPPESVKVRPTKTRGAGAARATPAVPAESPAAPAAETPPATEPAPTAPSQAAPPTTPAAATKSPPVVRAPAQAAARAPQQVAALDPFEGAGHPASPPLSPHRQDAPGLFAQALTERQEGRSQTAIATFRSLQREFPASREATVSLVSLGDLLLGTGLRAEALLAFETYLQRAPSGTLLPEAWIGKARALDALGRATEARAAWREIAKRFPDSPYARRARGGDSAPP
jgi:TolA-binding protein